MVATAGYCCWDLKRNYIIMKELKIQHMQFINNSIYRTNGSTQNFKQYFYTVHILSRDHWVVQRKDGLRILV